MDYTIDAFVEKLLKEKGVTGVSAEVLAQMKADLNTRAEEVIQAEILSNMPAEALEEFEQKLDTGSDEEVQEFCKKHIPNLESVTAKALLDFGQTYLAK